MIGLSFQVLVGDRQTFLPPDSRTLQVDGTWVDPGMMGDGIPRAFERIRELCDSLGVRDLQEYVLSEDLQWQLEELEEEFEELEEEGENDEAAKVAARIQEMQVWHDPAEALETVRALEGRLRPLLVPDPGEPGDVSLPASVGLPHFFVWQLRVYAELLGQADRERWKFRFEVMS